MGFMNATRGLRTTHLDSLAKGGVILKNYYVQPICSPTRSALMTGRYTIRLGTQSNVFPTCCSVLVPSSFRLTPQGVSHQTTLLCVPRRIV